MDDPRIIHGTTGSASKKSTKETPTPWYVNQPAIGIQAPETNTRQDCSTSCDYERTTQSGTTALLIISNTLSGKQEERDQVEHLQRYLAGTQPNS